MKRIPLIKFPKRHPAQPAGSSASSDEFMFFKSTSQPKPASSSGDAPSYRFRSDVPAAPSNTAVGGKASLLPKRTPVSDKEIEAILEAFRKCFSVDAEFRILAFLPNTCWVAASKFFCSDWWLFVVRKNNNELEFYVTHEGPQA